MPSLASKTGLRSYSYYYFSKVSAMKTRHEALRLNRIINFFAAAVLLLFVLLMIGLVQMRLNTAANIDQASHNGSKNPLEVGLSATASLALRAGWQAVWHTNIALAAKAKKPAPPSPYAAKFNPEPTTALELQSGETATLKLFLENTGTYRWHRSGAYALTYRVIGTTKGASPIFHQSWYKLKQPARLIEDLVAPKSTGSFEFIIAAPAKAGTYKETFQAVTKNNKIIKNSRFAITVTVTAKTADAAVTPPSIGQLSSNLGNIPANEPNIRVGLFQLLDATATRISYDGPYDITRENGELIKSMDGGAVTSLRYDITSGLYFADTTAGSFQENAPLRLIPKNTLEPAIILSSEQLHRWSSANTDNRFRGVIEIRYSKEKNATWIINQLPLDYYVKGLGVAGDNSPGEYLKAIYSAARTYALFHYLNPYKHATLGFTVDAVVDQAYRGYNQELRSPHSNQMIDTAKGIVVTYKNQVVITPYFSESDGRTRSWSEVWGGKEKQWLVSVPTPSDADKLLRGHGVGLDASEARARAVAGASFADILKYFYQGTGLKKLY